MSDIPSVDARKALADLGEPPRVTTTLPPAGSAAPASAPPHKGLMSPNGKEAFDPMRHSQDRYGNPMARADGFWMRRRGNGGRALKGLPPTGAPYLSPPAKAAPSADQVDEPAPAASSAGAGGAVVDAVPAPGPELLTEADYEGTAIGVQNAMFGLCRLFFGSAWEPDDNERDTWRGALRRLWCHYQLPRLGPLLEVIVLVPVTIAKRREDARTQQGWAKIRIWLGLKPKDEKPKDDGDAERKVA